MMRSAMIGVLALAMCAPVAAQPAAQPTTAAKQRYAVCLSQVKTAPELAIDTANAWRIEGGGVPARHCLALAQMARGDYAAALKSFEAAALAAEPANDGTAPELWAQAGNAALLAGQSDAAVTYLSTAIAEAAGSAKAEPLIDRARAYVELGKTAEATADLDRVTTLAPANTTGWLLKATLARRLNDNSRAEAALLEAVNRAPDDPDVLYEVGAQRAMAGKMADACLVWRQLAEAAPASTAGKSAAAEVRAACGDVPQN